MFRLVGRPASALARNAQPIPRLRRSLCTSNPWATLGVPRNADLDECKAAFRKLALALHPDVATSAADAEKFAAVVEAYEAIEQGDVHQPRPRGPRGVRVVGGVLVVSVEALKSDPAYEVHTVRVRFEEEADEPSAPSSPSSDTAISTETIREVLTSGWDSVADLRMLLQEELGLPDAPHARTSAKKVGGAQHELIYRGQLLGEHLFLGPDYQIADGDVVHFAAARAPAARRDAARDDGDG